MNDFSWVLGILGVIGLLIAGRRVWWGWLINLTNEVLWVAFAIKTQQYGFVLMAVAYGTIYANNAYQWRKHQ